MAIELAILKVEGDDSDEVHAGKQPFRLGVRIGRRALRRLSPSPILFNNHVVTERVNATQFHSLSVVYACRQDDLFGTDVVSQIALTRRLNAEAFDTLA